MRRHADCSPLCFMRALVFSIFLMSLAFHSYAEPGVETGRRLSLAEEMEIYQFAYEIGAQIREIPAAWREIAETEGVGKLKVQISKELENLKSKAPLTASTENSESYLDEFYFY